jgi:hypothetical protein
MKEKTNQFSLFENVMLIFLGLTALSALYISFYMELVPYRSILSGIDYVIINGVTVTIVIAATFNAAKIGITWIFAHMKVAGKNPFSAYALRLVLITNSLFMTLFVVTGQFTAPNAEEVLMKNIRTIEQLFYDKEHAARENHRLALEQMKASYLLEREEFRNLYQPDLDEAAEGQKYEMKNVVNGIWKGEKYNEWNDKYYITQEKLNKALVQAFGRYRDKLDAHNTKYEQKLESIAAEKQAALDNESIEKYLNSYESQNRLVVSFIAMMNKATGLDIGPHHITLLVASLITAIVEFVPLLLGAHIFTRILLRKHQDINPAMQPALGEDRV